MVKILIPKDTIGKDRNGGSLRFITIKKQSEAVDALVNCQHICSTYDIGPMGSTLEPFAYLIFIYNDSQVPAGVAEENLVLATLQDGVWEVLEGCVVDPEKNTITAPIDHFSVYTAMARTAPAEFEVTDMTVNPAEVEVGAPVTVSVTVTNTGDLTGDYTVVLKISKIEEQEKAVTLEGGASQTVTFTVSPDKAGTYALDIMGLSGQFSVKEPEAEVAEIPAEPETTPTPTQEPVQEPVKTTEPEPTPEPVATPEIPQETIPPPSAGFAWWIIIVGVAAGIAVGGGVFFFIWRRGRT